MKGEINMSNKDFFKEMDEKDKAFRQEQIRGEKTIVFFFVLIISLITFLKMTETKNVPKPTPCHCVAR